MAAEQWSVAPGESLVLELDGVTRLTSALIGGAIDVIGRDDATTTIEIDGVEGRDLTIALDDGTLTIDHPRLGFERFVAALTGRDEREPAWGGYGKARARVSVAVPRATMLELGQVTASVLATGTTRGAQVNTVNGEVQLESVTGRLDCNTVSGEVAAVNHEGDVQVHSVSGDVTVTGHIADFNANSVSGAVFLDVQGPIRTIDVNTVSGSVTARVDAGPGIDFSSASATGTVTVDALSVPKNSSQTLDGDPHQPVIKVRVNTVSGRVSLIRRGEAA